MEKIKLFLLNAYFYPLFLIGSGIVIPVLTLLVAFWRLFHSHRSTMRRFRRAISLYGRVVTLLPYPAIRVRYEDQGKDEPAGPYIFVANHRSTADAYLMGILPQEVVIVAKTWSFHIPVLGPYAKWSGYLNVLNMPPEEFFARAGRLLREGVGLIFFPEGTRSGRRALGSFHGAAFRLALQERVTIVPLCISGSENIPKKGTLMLRPGVIRVRRLPGIPFEEFRDLSAYALKNRVREIIQNELTAMEGAA